MVAVDENTLHRLIGKRTNGRSLRRVIKNSVAASLPNICATFSVPLEFSKFGDGYEDYDMHMRDAAALMALLLCDPSNRYVPFVFVVFSSIRVATHCTEL